MTINKTARTVTVLIAGLVAGGAEAASSCRQDVGNADAQAYVEQCLEVSPATHPPCNADNPCQMIWDEIARGCAMLGNDAPGFCDDYSG